MGKYNVGKAYYHKTCTNINYWVDDKKGNHRFFEQNVSLKSFMLTVLMQIKDKICQC